MTESSSATHEPGGSTHSQGGALWPWWVLPCGLLIVLHLLLATTVEVPQKGDELVYLGNARYLATGEGLVDATGRDPYKIGYSLFLVPAMWVDSSPLGGFSAVQVVNALLMTSLFPALFFLARRLSPSLGRFDQALLAGALACYPAVMLYATTAMSENAFVPLFAWLVLFAHRALADHRIRDWAMLALFTVLLYFVHERAVGILVGVTGLAPLAALIAWRRHGRGGGGVRPVVAYGGTAALVYALLRYVEVPGSRWQTGTRSGGFLERALALPESLAATFSGHLWYLMLATGGCLALGLTLRCLEARTAGEGSPSSRWPPLFPWFLAGSTLSVLAISTIFLAQRPEAQFTHWVYGRYVEGVLLPPFLVALLALRPLAKGRPWVGRGGVVMLGVMALAVVLAAIIDGLWTEAMGMAYSFNTTSLPIYNQILGVGILRATASFLALAVILWLPFLWRWRAGVCGLAILFCCSTVVTLEDSWIARAEETARQHRLADLVRQLEPPRQVILHEPRGKVHHFHYYNLSYFLPEYRFITFGKKVQGTPPGDLVLSSDLQFGERHPGARLLGSERMPAISLGYSQSLWVLPGAFSRRLQAQGYWAVRTSP